MKYLSLFLFLFLFQSVAQEDTDSNYQVHCDCQYVAGVGTEQWCVVETEELMQADLGAIHFDCGDNDNLDHLKDNNKNCTCIFSHSVYAFGSNRDSAIENAKATCAAVSKETSKNFVIRSPEKCKDEQ